MSKCLVINNPEKLFDSISIRHFSDVLNTQFKTAGDFFIWDWTLYGEDWNFLMDTEIRNAGGLYCNCYITQTPKLSASHTRNFRLPIQYIKDISVIAGVITTMISNPEITPVVEPDTTSNQLTITGYNFRQLYK